MLAERGAQRGDEKPLASTSAGLPGPPCPSAPIPSGELNLPARLSLQELCVAVSSPQQVPVCFAS